MKGIALWALAFVVGTQAQLDQCPVEQETNWEIEWLMKHEDCHKFYKCVFGQPVEFTCPSDLYFNIETWQCDYQFNVDCNRACKPSLTTPESTESSNPVPTSEPITPTTTSTTTTTTTSPIPTTTTTTMTTSTTPIPTTASTSESPECEIEISPDSPPEEEDEEDVGGEEVDEEADEEEVDEEEVELEFLPNGCPVDSQVQWLLPNEEDCSLFYYCVWGGKVLRECPGALHFNPVLQVCDWPQSAGCAVSANKHAEARRLLLEQIL